MHPHDEQLSQEMKVATEVTNLLLLEMLRSHLRDAPTKSDLKELEKKIMSAISDFAAKQTAHNQKIETSVDGLTADIKSLNDLIQTLQTSQGQITPEDQKLLDQIEQKSDAIEKKLTALDELTPPAVPTPTV